MTGPQQTYALCALAFVTLCGAVMAGTRTAPMPSNEPIPAVSSADLVKMGVKPTPPVASEPEVKPEVEPEPKQEEAASPVASTGASDGRSAYRERGLYSGTYICREIESWEKAQQLLKAGHDYLDRDEDGVACEALR